MGKPQFSVRALLLTVSAIALVLSMMFQPPPEVAAFAVTGIVLASLAFSAIGIIYGKNNVRPFCIGVAIPAALAFCVAVRNEHWFLQVENISALLNINPRWPAILLGMMELTGIALGYLCVVVRWLIDRPGNGDEKSKI